MDLQTNALSPFIENMSKLYKTTHPNGSKMYGRLIVEEYHEWIDEWEGTPEDFKEICDLIWVSIMQCIEKGYPIVEGMEELTKEFKSKFYDKEGNYCPTFREDGKLLKGSGFKKADFKQFFNK